MAPSTATVAVGATLSLNAEVHSTGGDLLTNQRIQWSSEDATIAAVSENGVVTGRKVGVVLIAASARGRDAFARVTVNPTPVASVRLSASQQALLVGQAAQLTADPLDTHGQTLLDRPVTWSSSDESVANVSTTGLVTALAPGAAFVTATAEGKSAVALISVSSVPVASLAVTPASNALVVGQTTQLTAEVFDDGGNPLVGRPVTWTTSAAPVATVASDGLVTALSPGIATITAWSEGRSASAVINVSPRPVSAITISPGQISLYPRDNVQLSAMVTDDRGQVLTGRPMSFSSSNSLVATVSASGFLTAVSPGTATITASSEGITGTAAVTVAPEPVASVDVFPNAPNIVVGQAIQLSATPRNSGGQPLSGRVVMWSSGAPSLATVSAAGTVTGVAPGTAVILATVEGKQGTALVNIRLAPVARVLITPSAANVLLGQSVTLTANTLDANGTVLGGRVIGWSSSDPTIATVSNAGVVTGLASGTVTVSATSEGQTGTATVTVSLVAPVATVAVSPNSASAVVGQRVTFTASTFDAAGSPLSGRQVSWATSASSVATVSNSGVVTAVGAGTATITATSEGQSGAATITVTAPPLASITVSPSTVTMNVSSSQTLTATARDALGNVMTGVPIAWSSSDPSVAAVSAAGVVTAVAPGSATITASSGSISGSASVTVQLTPIHHIIVTPSNPSVDIGKTLQMTATVYDAQNNVLTGRTVTWASSEPSRVTVNSAGLVTGIRKGSSNVSATAGGKKGETKVTVP